MATRGSARGMHRPNDEQRARLQASGRVIGVPVTVTDDDTWEAEPSGVRVGLAHFTNRGHAAADATALSTLELWSRVRPARVAPARLRRSRALVTAHPEWRIAVDAADRLLAAGDLLVTMPAYRAPLASATVREVPFDLQPWLLHLQWIGAITRLALAPGASVSVAAEVGGELARLGADAGEANRLLWQIMAPTSGVTELRRLERALGLLLPPYLRLMSQDIAARGLAASAPGAGDDGAGDSADAAKLDLAVDAADTAGDPLLDEDDADSGPWTDATSAEPDSDLFAVEHTTFEGAILPTPLQAESGLGALIEDLLDDTRVDPLESGSAGIVSVDRPRHGPTLDAYAERVARNAAQIEQLRDVWRRLVARRMSLHRALSREAFSDGEAIDAESLARVVAEAQAGERRPRLFQRRSRRPRKIDDTVNVDYVLIIDRSGSMQGPRMQHAADAAVVLLEALAGAMRDAEALETSERAELGVHLRAAVIVFDAAASTVAPLSAGVGDDVRAALLSALTAPGGATNDADALRLARDVLGVGSDASRVSAGAPTRRIVILVSDGGSNDPAAARAAMAELEVLGVTVWGIGLGSTEIAERYAPTGRTISAASDLPRAIGEIIEEDLAGGGERT